MACLDPLLNLAVDLSRIHAVSSPFAGGTYV